MKIVGPLIVLRLFPSLLAMCDAAFLPFPPSTVALAAIRVASGLNGISYEAWVSLATKLVDIDLLSPEIMLCSNQLLDALIVCFPALEKKRGSCLLSVEIPKKPQTSMAHAPFTSVA